MKPSDLNLALLCRQSYSKETYSYRDVECLVEETQEGTVIAFRGTDAIGAYMTSGWRDIIRDLRFLPYWDSRVGFAHAGFIRGAGGIVDKVLKTRLSRGRDLIITGHSLGGAIALCVAALLRAEGFKIGKLVTFGCPRVFLWGAHRCLREIPTTQYRQGHDFVTTVPWSIWGFMHAVKLKQLGKKPWRRTWKDHPIDLYINALKEKER